MKFDVEGAEPLVCRGLPATLAANPSITIVMEWAPKQLQAAGFDLGTFVGELRATALAPSMLHVRGQDRISFEDLLTRDYCSGVALQAP